MNSRKGNMIAASALLIALAGAIYVVGSYQDARRTYFADKAEEAAAAAMLAQAAEEIRVEAAKPPDRYVAPAPIVLPIY